MSQPTHRPLLPIFLIVAVDVLGLTIVLPLLPFYAQHYGASPTLVGLLVTTYALCQLLSGPVLGRISDRIGRKPVLIVSQIGTLIGFLILATANSLWIVFLSRVIDGATAGNLSIAQAYISDVTKPEDRAKSSAISGYLSQFGYSYPIYAAAGLSAASILATVFLLPKGEVRDAADDGAAALPAGRRLGLLDWGNYLRYFRDPAIAPRLWQFLLFSLTFSLFITGFPLFAERRYVTAEGAPYGAREVGYCYAYAGLLGILLQGGLIRKLVPRFGEHALVVSGFATAAVAHAMLGFTYHLPGLLAATTISTYGTGVLRPVLTSLISQATPRREQGVVLGLTQSINSIAQITAPILAGVLIDHGNLIGWALSAAAVPFIGLLIGRKLRLSKAPG
jgi:MFS family permease